MQENDEKTAENTSRPPEMSGYIKITSQKLKDVIDRGYHHRKDYPSFALTPWDDRNRYRDYIFKIIDEYTSI